MYARTIQIASILAVFVGLMIGFARLSTVNLLSGYILLLPFELLFLKLLSDDMYSGLSAAALKGLFLGQLITVQLIEIRALAVAVYVIWFYACFEIVRTLPYVGRHKTDVLLCLWVCGMVVQLLVFYGFMGSIGLAMQAVVQLAVLLLVWRAVDRLFQPPVEARILHTILLGKESI